MFLSKWLTKKSNFDENTVPKSTKEVKKIGLKWLTSFYAKYCYI